MSNNIQFNLLKDDMIDEYLNLIKNLSDTIERDNIVNLMNYYKIMELYPFIQIWTIKDTYYNKLIGCGTLILEPKFIHKCSNVGHIEDICISPEYKGNGYGKMLIKLLVDISKENNCYKVILNCKDENKVFYEKCGFNQKNVQMGLYLNNDI